MDEIRWAGAMNGQLEIGVLGELSVVRDGKPVALPRSKKTRALLAYLVVSGGNACVTCSGRYRTIRGAPCGGAFPKSARSSIRKARTA